MDAKGRAGRVSRAGTARASLNCLPLLVIALASVAQAAPPPAKTNQAAAIAQSGRAASTIATAAPAVAPANSTRPLSPLATTTQVQDRVYLIEIVDSTGEKTYQTVPLDRYHRLRNEAGLRNRLQPKALAQAREEWKEINAGVSKAFPPNVANEESVTSLGLFTSDDAARVKLMELRSKAEQRHAADDEKMSALEKQIKALKEDTDRLVSSNPNSARDRDNRVESNRSTLRILERDLAEQNAKKAKQEESLREARSLFEKKLTALVSATSK